MPAYLAFFSAAALASPELSGSSLACSSNPTARSTTATVFVVWLYSWRSGRSAGPASDGTVWFTRSSTRPDR
ncbi:hypothetical protein PF001_g29823, partial [Phytophthora fragariae]